MEYDMHQYVLIIVKCHENKNHCGFVTLEWDIYIYIGSGSSSIGAAMFHRHFL